MENKKIFRMRNLNDQLIKHSKRFNMKQIKKLNIFFVYRLLEKLTEIDSDEVFHLTKSLNEKLSNLDFKSKEDVKEYKKAYKLLFNVIKKQYPNYVKKVIRNKGTLIASSSTLGSSNSSVSAGAVGAAVAVASSMNFDNVYIKFNCMTIPIDAN